MFVMNPDLKYESVNFIELAAKKAVNIDSDSIKVAQMDRLDDGTILTVLKNTDIFKRGPRKGKTKYLDKVATVSITSDMINDQAEIFKNETGRCSKCFGNGLVWWGWSEADGTRYKNCPDCP